MKLDVNLVITNTKKEPLKLSGPDVDRDGKTIEAANLTLADVLINAALTPEPGKTYREEEHVQRYQIAINTENARTAKPPEIEISAEVAAFLKKDISRLYPSLVAGQVLPKLDGK